VGVGIMVVEGDTRLLLWRIVGGGRRMMLRWGFVRGVQRLVVVVGAQLCDLRGFDSSREFGLWRCREGIRVMEGCENGKAH
jgi:hypothetical protein